MNRLINASLLVALALIATVLTTPIVTASDILIEDPMPNLQSEQRLCPRRKRRPRGNRRPRSEEIEGPVGPVPVLVPVVGPVRGVVVVLVRGVVLVLVRGVDDVLGSPTTRAISGCILVTMTQTRRSCMSAKGTESSSRSSVMHSML